MLCVSFTERPRRCRHRRCAVTTFSNIKCFNTPNEYGKSNASFLYLLCVYACVSLAQLLLIHLILCLFVKFFCELFFVSLSFNFNYPPRKSVSSRPKFGSYYNPASGCIEALNYYCISLFAHLLCSNKTHSSAFEL